MERKCFQNFFPKRKLGRSISEEKMLLLRSNFQSQSRRLVWDKTSSRPIQSSPNVKANREGINSHSVSQIHFKKVNRTGLISQCLEYAYAGYSLEKYSWKNTVWKIQGKTPNQTYKKYFYGVKYVLKITNVTFAEYSSNVVNNIMHAVLILWQQI